VIYDQEVIRTPSQHPPLKKGAGGILPRDRSVLASKSPLPPLLKGGNRWSDCERC
jgi:hypothetical protein